MFFFSTGCNVITCRMFANCCLQKLMAKDLDNWEQKRVKRLPGEPDGRL